MDDTIELELQLEPEHYGCLAVYGSAIREHDDSIRPEYGESYVDNFVGREVSDKLDSLERLGYLEKHFVEKTEDDHMYKPADDKKVIQDAENIMKYIDEEYSGKIYDFIEEFDETDRKQLTEYEVKLAQ